MSHAILVEDYDTGEHGYIFSCLKRAPPKKNAVPCRARVLDKSFFTRRLDYLPF